MKVSCRICSIADLHPTFSFMTTAEISFYQTRNISEKNFSQKKRNPSHGADYYVIEWIFFKLNLTNLTNHRSVTGPLVSLFEGTRAGHTRSLG